MSFDAQTDSKCEQYNKSYRKCDDDAGFCSFHLQMDKIRHRIAIKFI